MRIAVVGAGAAGLTAAYGLRNVDGVSVEVFERSDEDDSADRRWASAVNLKYLRRRGLFGESIGSEAPLEQSITHREFGLTDGDRTRCTTTTVSDDAVHTVTRSHFEGWMRNQLRTTDVGVVRDCRVKSLVRRNRRVVGLHTSKGIFRSDLVFLAEGDAGRLIDNENYSRLLGDRTPNYLAVVQQRFQGPLERTGVLSESSERPEASTASVFSLPAPEAGGSANILGRVLPLSDGFSFEALVPLQQLRRLQYNPPELLQALKNYPVVDDLLGERSDGDIHYGLIKTTTAGSEPNLVDHGLVLGGGVTGAGTTLPTMNKFATATQMGYQFSATVRKLRPKVTRPTRDVLEQYYATPLRENPEFVFSDPQWMKVLWDSPAFLSELADWYFNSGAISASFVAKWLSTVSDRPASSLGRVVKTLASGLPDSLGTLWKNSPASNAEFRSGWISRAVFDRLAAEVISECFTDDAEVRRAARKRLGRSITLLSNWLISGDGSRGSGFPVRSDSGNFRPSELGESPGGSAEASVSLLVEGSLGEPHATSDLNALCPAGVFDDRSGDLFDINDSDCIRCEYCYWGFPVAEVRSSDQPNENGDKKPLMTDEEYFPVLTDRRSDTDQTLHQSYTFLRRLKRALAEVGNYVTPDELDWLESYASLTRREISELATEASDTSAPLDELLTVIKRVERSLAGGELNYAEDLCEQILSVHLNRFDSFDTHPDLLEDDYRSFDTNKTTVNLNAQNTDVVSGRSSDSSTQVRNQEPGSYDGIIFEYYEWYRSILSESFEGFNSGETVNVEAVGSIRDQEFHVIAERSNPEVVLAVTVDRNLKAFRPRNFPDSVQKLTSGLFRFRFTADEVTILEETTSSLPELTGSRFTLGNLEYQRILVEGLRINEPDTRCSLGEQAKRTYYEPRITLVEKALAALRDFPADLTEVPDRINLVKTLAAGVLMEAGFGNPMLSRTVLSDGNDPGLLCFDELDFLRCFPLAPTFEDWFSDADVTPRGELTNAILSLTDREETLWSNADQDGVFDDLIRQWRRTAGDCRQLLTDDGQSERFRSNHLLRLFVARCLLTKTQYKLRAGKPARRTKLSADLWMRQTFEWLSKYQRPEDFEGDTVKRMDTEPVKSSEERFDPTETFFNGRIGPKLKLLSSLSGTTRNWLHYESKIVREDDREDLYFLSRYGSDLTNWLERSEVGSASTMRLVGILAVNFLDHWMGHFDRPPTDELLNKGSFRYWQRVRSNLLNETVETLYSDSDPGALETLRQRARNEWWDKSRIDDEELLDQVNRAFERADVDVLPYLVGRSNLVPWYRSFYRLLAGLFEFHHKPYSISLTDDDEGSAYGGWCRNRLKREIRAHASLVAHGLREAGNDEDAPETQLHDMAYPESIYQRRYSLFQSSSS